MSGKGAKPEGIQSKFRREVFEVRTVNNLLEFRVICQ